MIRLRGGHWVVFDLCRIWSGILRFGCLNETFLSVNVKDTVKFLNGLTTLFAFIGGTHCRKKRQSWGAGRKQCTEETDNS